MTKPHIEILKKSKQLENKENCTDKVLPIKIPEVPTKASEEIKEEQKTALKG